MKACYSQLESLPKKQFKTTILKIEQLIFNVKWGNDWNEQLLNCRSITDTDFVTDKSIQIQTVLPFSDRRDI